MLQYNPDSLKSPVYAGVVAAVLHMLFSYLMDRYFSPPTAVQAGPREYVRPAVVTGAITAVVMYIAMSKNSGSLLSEPFD